MSRSLDESAPLWHEAAPDAPPASHEPLTEAQVCVVGAGISGLTTAYLLQQAGFQVQVIEAQDTLGAGESGRTTAHLTAVLDDRFCELEKLFGMDSARLAADSHRAAIDRIESIVNEESIACDFERVDGYLVCGDDGQRSLFRDETMAAGRAGFPGFTLVETLHLPEVLIDGPALRFPRQAMFHIGKYLRGLAAAFTRMGGRLVMNTRVMRVRGGRAAHLDLASGSRVYCDSLVIATNTPFNDRVRMHTKQAAYRTYVVGIEIPQSAGPAFLLWDLADPYHYVRRVRGVGKDTLLVGGEDHKTGQYDDANERYRRLESWARQRFAELGALTHRWSGQVMEPVDGLAFIGRNPLDDDNVYIVTGDSGNGMTHGTLAGMIISDLIAGRGHPLERLYDPSRKTLKAAGTYVNENANFVGHMVRDWVRGGEVSDRGHIARGEGAIVNDGVSRIAAYRDLAGELHEVSAVCTHLGCVVQWNGGEKSWDCPCHGSRFAIDGAILNGPARHALKPVEPEPARPGESEQHQPRP